jgi:hypothetical protein
LLPGKERERVVQRVTPGAQESLQLFINTELFLEGLELSGVSDSFEAGVNLFNQSGDSGQVNQKSLRDEDASIVLALFSSGNDIITDVVDNIGELLVSSIAFFSDNNHVRACLEGTLNGQVGGFLSHEADEVPVLDGRCTIGKHVSNQLRVDFRAGVESNSGLEVRVVQVSVNRGRYANNLRSTSIAAEVVSELGGICHGRGSSDQNEAIKEVFLTALEDFSVLANESSILSISEEFITTQVSVGCVCFFFDF